MNQGERAGERWVLPGVGRRHFLIGAAAAAAALAAGCSSDSDGASSSSTTAPPKLGSITTEPIAGPDGKPLALAGDPFSLGVASGDPIADAVVIWTRLAPDALAEDGAGGMPAGKFPVVWEVSDTKGFDRNVAQGIAMAEARFGHSVHVDVTGLQPATDYWYRFTAGDEVSSVGRTRTLPEGAPTSFGLGIVNCQMYENGAYGAYRHLVDEDIDLVAHLGDYIYELPGGTGAGRHSVPNRSLKDLTDFRLRYASYKLDPDLQAAHARFPWVVTWDDHEVANNYMGDSVPGDAPPEVIEARRTAAYQAWWEHMPVRLDPPKGSSLAVYRDFSIGSLAHLYLLDERQYADPTPCKGETVGATDYGDCAAVEGEDRTRLGADQEAWLANALESSDATWNLLGNPVALSGIDAGTDAPAYYLDLWDGYPDARKRLAAQLAKVDNPVVLTGDYHAGMVLDLHATPFDQESPVVAPEFLAPAISSPLFSQDVTGRTPQLRQQINKHGYLTVAVTPKQLTATFRVLDDVKDPKTAISTESTWQVTKGDPVAKQL